MESRIYGIIDISNTETGAKRYATLHGYDKIGYRVGYNAFFSAEKINNKWVNCQAN